MAYRDDLAALEARKATVDAELAEKQRARDEVAWMVEEARKLARAEAAFLGEAPERTRARRRPTAWLAVFAALVGFGGFAAYRATRSTQSRAEASLREMASWVDAMCACRDEACVERLSDHTTKSRKEAANQEPPTFDEAQTKRLTELGRKASECLRDALAPPPAPSIPTPASTPATCAGVDELSCVVANYESDACCSKFPKGSELAVTRNGDWYLVRRYLPNAIDRAMISAGIARVKSQVRSCRDQSLAEGMVKVHVKVDANGKVTNVHVEDAPDPYLGACVAAAVTRATFAQTQNGGSFSYPFVFDPNE